MCIVWLAEDSHEMSSLILLKNTNKKIKMTLATVVINALRVIFLAMQTKNNTIADRNVILSSIKMKGKVSIE